MDIPREWVFEHYLKLSNRLMGQDIKIKSPFNVAGDKSPSFFIYFSRTNSRYMFKDFSTDRHGDGVDLVKELFDLTTRGESAHMIIKDYNNYLKQNPDKRRDFNIKPEAKWKVTSFTTRNWNVIDKGYWLSYKINSNLLTSFNVKPLANYTRTREETEESKLMDRTQMYGFFCKDGSLYKIYQPHSTAKFIKIKEYIQGSDQLTFDKKYLIICSSLKDLMAFNTLNIKNAECIAPDSENVLIPEDIIKSYKEQYAVVCTLFDNDAAGIKSMKKYKERYDIPYVHLNLEKDLADCIKEHGIVNTRTHLYPLLTKTLTGKTKHL